MQCRFKKNDYICLDNSENDIPKIFFVVVVKRNNVIIRNEEDDSLVELATHYVNRDFNLIDPKTIKDLYKETE